MKFLLDPKNEFLIAVPCAISLFLFVSISLSFFLNSQASLFEGVTTPRGLSVAQSLGQKIFPQGRLPVPDKVPVRKMDAEELLVVDGAFAATIIDVNSGDVLFDQLSMAPRAIASTTKLLTAMIVVDRMQDLDSYITIPEAIKTMEGSRVGCKNSYFCGDEVLRVGERVSVRDLLRATLVASANDAATTLALHVGESEEGFANLMNLRMKELGLYQSNFCRPSGLELDIPEDEALCNSSAREIGQVAATLARDPKYKAIIEILSEKEGTFASEDGTIVHKIESTIKREVPAPEIIAEKTGFTPRAGLSLISIGQDEQTGQRVVAVVLDDLDRFADTQSMITWGLASHVWH